MTKNALPTSNNQSSIVTVAYVLAQSTSAGRL